MGIINVCNFECPTVDGDKVLINLIQFRIAFCNTEIRLKKIYFCTIDIYIYTHTYPVFTNFGAKFVRLCFWDLFV